MKATYSFNKARNFIIGLVGALLFSISYCMFLVPSNLYCGSVTGIAQIIQDLLQYMHVSTPQGLDLTGSIFWLLNVPLFILAYFHLGHGFLYRTIVTVCFQSLCFSSCALRASFFRSTSHRDHRRISRRFWHRSYPSVRKFRRRSGHHRHVLCKKISQFQRRKGFTSNQPVCIPLLRLHKKYGHYHLFRCICLCHEPCHG